MIVPDFDDIVFEKLNKEYGAYFLRKKYSRVLILSIVVSCLLGSAMVLIPFLKIFKIKSNKIYTSVLLTSENMGAPGDYIFSPPPPPPPSVAHQAPGTVNHMQDEIRYIAPVVVDTIIPTENELTSSGDSLSGIMTDLGIPGGKGDGKGIISETGGSGGGIGGTGVYSSAEIMPKFRGGDIDKFREWVKKNTKYPETATINNIHGKVYVTFIVENDGSVSNVRVIKGVDPLINDEALKAVKSSPKWTPGKQRGIAVRVSYLIMLNFAL
jgi:periplasmic protein TonB